TSTSARPPSFTWICVRSRPSLCMAAHLGSAESLTFSGAGTEPSYVIFPEMDAVPVAAPPPAAGAPAAGAAAGGGVESVFEGSPPPQAARMTRAPALMRAREFRTIIGKAPLKIVWGSKLAQSVGQGVG